MSLLDLWHPPVPKPTRPRTVALSGASRSTEEVARQRVESLALARAAKAAKRQPMSPAERRARQLATRRDWYARNRDKLRAAKRREYWSRKSMMDTRQETL